jgi:lipopolysaccharide export LptBFGC system permease protein LptF
MSQNSFNREKYEKKVSVGTGYILMLLGLVLSVFGVIVGLSELFVGWWLVPAVIFILGLYKLYRQLP